MTADFLIVGGGIGGTVLAELLGRGGRKVVVLEKSTVPPAWSRPEVLWPATTEILFSLLPRETWEHQAALPLRGVEIFDGREFIPLLSTAVIAAANVQPWATDPNRTRELLLGLRSFDLRRGVEVTEVLKEKERVLGVRAREVATGVQFDVLARWTVGDDGGNSIVRSACGIALPTRLFPVEFLCFAFDWPATFAPGIGRLWPNRHSAHSGILGLGGIPVPQARGVGLALVHGKTLDRHPDPARSWEKFCAASPGLREAIGSRRFPQDFARVRRAWGHASGYGAPGALLMGDAAHPVSPVGGQGANMSVADARVLAELALRDEPNLISEYECRRRPANERSMRFTRAGALLFGLPRWLLPVAPVFGLVRRLSRHPSFFARRLRFVSTAFLEKPLK
jgi:2-polyprenyl-6-methoxyphenol hydroxylase-like FAD-dependent oxidoreductase